MPINLGTANMDGVTAPADPTDITIVNGASNFRTSTTQAVSSPNSLEWPATTDNSEGKAIIPGAVSSTPKMLSADRIVVFGALGTGGTGQAQSIKVLFTDADGYGVAGDPSGEYIGPQLYHASDGNLDRIAIYASAGMGGSIILDDQAVGGIWPENVKLHVHPEMEGDTIRVKIQRLDNNQYLQVVSGTASWTASEVWAYNDQPGSDLPDVDRVQFVVANSHAGTTSPGSLFTDDWSDDELDAAATSFTNTPAALNGKEGVAADFALAANGPTTADVTLSDGSETGTFSPTTPALDGTNDVPYTYTPAVTGVRRNITISASAVGLTAPGNITFEAWVQQVVTVTPGGPVSLSNSATQQFTKGVTGGPTGESSAGTWSKQSGGGTIDSSGLYTAPSSGTGSAVIRFTHTASGAFDDVTINYAPGVAVSVTPDPVTVDQEDTQQFTADVTGAVDESVTWSIQGSAGGCTINSSGLFTAGTTPGTYTVRATSVEDNTKFDDVTVTVPAVTIDASPNSSSIEPDDTLQLSAVVTGTVNTDVDWQVNEVGGGTVDSSGLYTAPSTPGTYTVTATSEADPSVSETVTIVVTAVPEVGALNIEAPTGLNITATLRGSSGAVYDPGTTSLISPTDTLDTYGTALSELVDGYYVAAAPSLPEDIYTVTYYNADTQQAIGFGSLDTRASGGLSGAQSTKLDAIYTKTNGLPSDPADQSAIAALIAALPTAVDNADELLSREKIMILLQFLSGKWRLTVGGSTMTIYNDDDTPFATAPAVWNSDDTALIGVGPFTLV